MSGRPSHCGTILRLAVAPGMRVAETRHPAHHALPIHDHEAASVSLVHSGSYREIQGRRVYPCPAGSLLLKPGGIRHRTVVGRAGAHTHFVELDEPIASRIRERTGLFSDVIHLERGSSARVASRLTRALRRPDPRAGGLEAEAAILDLLAEVLLRRERSEDRRVPGWLSRVRAAIDDEPGRGRSHAELAEIGGVHPAHLAATFRRVYGRTIGEHRRRRRVEIACRWLRESDLPIGTIATRLGFADHAHFSRTFRREIGTSPSRYRTEVRGSPRVVQGPE